MSYFLRFCSVLVGFLLLLSCYRDYERDHKLLSEAAAIVEQQPDSALRLLSAISQPEDLPKELRMAYTLRLVQAKDKADEDIAGNTAILTAEEYFVRKNNVAHAALAAFYSGRVHQEQKNTEEAAHGYLRAADYAGQVGSSTLQGMAYYNLGKLNIDKLLINNAISHYKQAYLCFCSRPDDYHRQTLALSSIGDCYMVGRQLDSALYYQEKGLALAQLHGDSTLQSSICQSIGIAFQEQGEAARAHSYFVQAAHFGTDTYSEIYLYRNLANSFIVLGKQDSAQHYMHLILQHNMQDTSNARKIITHTLLSGIEELRGNYKKSLEYHKLYADYLAIEYESMLSSSMREVEKKYQLEQLENSYNRKFIWFQRAIMGLLGLLLAVALAYLWTHRRYLRISKRLREQELEMVGLMKQAKEVEKKERLLRSKMLSLETKEKMLNELRQQHLNMLKRASLLKSTLTSDSRSKFKDDLAQLDQLIYGSKQGSTWQLLYHSLNELYESDLDKFQQLLPQLSETEFKVCCLSYVQFSNTEASIILGVSTKTILNLRTIIRKKLAIPCDIDICEFMKSLSRSGNGIG